MPHTDMSQSMSHRNRVKGFQKRWDVTYVQVNLQPSVVNRVRQRLLGCYIVILQGQSRICILPSITQLWKLLSTTSHRTIHSFVNLTKIIELRPYCRHFSSSWGTLVIKIDLVPAPTEQPGQLADHVSQYALEKTVILSWVHLFPERRYPKSSQ